MAETMAQRSPGKEFASLRILIANVPTDLKEWLVQEVQDQEDIEIVGQTCGYMDILIAAQKDVDVVVMSAEELQPPPGICSHLLSEFPDVKILLLSPSCDKAVLYWMGLHQKDLQGVSSEAILETLRQLGTLTDV